MNLNHLTISFLIALCLLLFVFYRLEASKSDELLEQIGRLESAYTIDYTRLKPLIKEKEVKVKSLERIPVYIMDNESLEACKNEIESIKNIVNNF